MQFAWKIFLWAVLIIILFFGIGGYFLIAAPFSASLERAKESAVRENTLLCFSFVTAADSPGQAPDDKEIQGLASQLLTSSPGLGLHVRNEA
jgi:hypothetical protein